MSEVSNNDDDDSESGFGKPPSKDCDDGDNERCAPDLGGCAGGTAPRAGVGAAGAAAGFGVFAVTHASTAKRKRVGFIREVFERKVHP